MKKVPKEFYIKGHRWTVSYDWQVYNDQGEECHAICLPDKRQIIIERGIPKEEKSRWFWHEYGHAMLHAFHLVAPADGGLNETQEGVFCEAFADVMENEWEIVPKKRKKK